MRPLAGPAAFFTLLLLLAVPAGGQTTAPAEQPLLGSVLTSDVLRDLPTSNNALAVLETIQPEAIGDRFTAGGLNAADAPRFGGFLNSWTQTGFRIGDVTMTDPRTGGTPLLLPILPFWERVTTAAGAMAGDDPAPALSMTLEPRRPGSTWFRLVEGALSGPFLVSEAGGPVPPVDRVHAWQDGSALVSGPLSDRLGVVLAGSWRGLSHVAAPNAASTADRVASGFAHAVFAATRRDEVRALGFVQRAATAAFTDTGVHVQSTWERHGADGPRWRVFGGYMQRDRSAPAPSTLVVDSLATDPVSDLIDTGAGAARRWMVGGRIAAAAGRPVPAVGLDAEWAQVRIAPAGVQQVRELVGSIPARVWTYAGGAPDDVRHLTTLAAFASEHWTRGRVTIDAGVRLESTSGAADRSAGDAVHWTTWLPRVEVGWRIVDAAGVEVVASYRRTAYQLPLNVLAVGDPAAPFADVSAWNGSAIGRPFARVGPGTGGDAAFAQIDPHLERPTTDELVLAVRARPRPGLQLELARVTKREAPLLGLVDVGVPSSEYSAFQVPDPSFLPGSPVGAPQVTVYDRPPASYGRDRYLLTNRLGEPARFWGVELSVRAAAERLTILAGGNLTWALGPAAAVGFLPTENDPDVVGNMLIDPNTATFARGQLFQDRSHAVKIAGIYRLPWRVRVGAIARYQDGQPFARLVVVPTLAQGTVAVRAYANGGSAFTYTGTLDVRLQKIFAAGRAEVAAILDVYNLPNLGHEVLEDVVSGPMFRTSTALQPPRTAIAGLRITF